MAPPVWRGWERVVAEDEDIQEVSMDFGLFTMFSTREGASQFHTFQEWFDLVQVAEDAGLDTLGDFRERYYYARVSMLR
jgi:hypothetical protein